mgnify:CR=1 FL=1
MHLLYIIKFSIIFLLPFVANAQIPKCQQTINNACVNASQASEQDVGTSWKLTGPKGIRFSAVAVPSCAANEYFTFVDSSTSSFKKCENGIISTIGSGGAGTSITPIFAISSCTEFTGSSPIFASLGACSDPSENAVEIKFTSALTINSISCQLSSATVGETVTIRARVGSCGSLSDQALICSVGAGSNNCSHVAAVNITSGQCLSFRISSSGTFVTAKYVNCTLEKTS